MSENVKGVFVQLPLSDEQKRLVKLSYSGSMNSDEAFNKSLHAIGTTVTGGELEVVCSIDEDILRDISELDDDDEEYVTDMVFKPNPEGVDTAPLVRQSDALAKLAEKDAEIARLREYYEASEALTEVGLFNATPEMFERERSARKALKGPEA